MKKISAKMFIKSKILLFLGIIIGLIILVYVFAYIMISIDLRSKDFVGMGKQVDVTITESSDYTIFEKDSGLLLWNKGERKKMIKYMKKNNLKLKPGKYTINQAHTFKKVQTIFQFDKP